MPKTSSAALAVVRPTRHVPRVKPGRKLTSLEQRFWTEAVDALPAGYFGSEQRQQLEAYVGHAALAAMLGEKLADGPIDADWLKVNAAQIAQSKAALAFARSLRLTLQARLDKTVAATQSRLTGPATLEQMKARYAEED